MSKRSSAKAVRTGPPWSDGKRLRSDWAANPRAPQSLEAEEADGDMLVALSAATAERRATNRILEETRREIGALRWYVADVSERMRNLVEDIRKEFALRRDDGRPRPRKKPRQSHVRRSTGNAGGGRA
jgi:hypothetical protein